MMKQNALLERLGKVFSPAAPPLPAGRHLLRVHRGDPKIDAGTEAENGVTGDVCYQVLSGERRAR